MLFIVTGPTGPNDFKDILVLDAPNIDAAALGAGRHLGFRADGQVTVEDFKNPDSSREYRYLREIDGSDTYTFLKVEPTEILKVGERGETLPYD
jgi:hypothetical protein